MSGAGCCVVHNEVWVCGGETPDRRRSTDAVYSWMGPENEWIERPLLPDRMNDHRAMYDGDKMIWALTGADNANVYKYHLGVASWTPMDPLSKGRWNSSCVRLGQHIFSLEGYVPEEGHPTNTILVTNTNTGNTFTADTKLPENVRGHCAAIIKQLTIV